MHTHTLYYTIPYTASIYILFIFSTLDFIVGFLLSSSDKSNIFMHKYPTFVFNLYVQMEKKWMTEHHTKQQQHNVYRVQRVRDGDFVKMLWLMLNTFLLWLQFDIINIIIFPVDIDVVSMCLKSVPTLLGRLIFFSLLFCYIFCFVYETIKKNLLYNI